MKYKVAIVGNQGSFSKEEIIEKIKTDSYSFCTFLVSLDTEFDLFVAETVIALMQEECKYGLEVLVSESHLSNENEQKERYETIARRADNTLVVTSNRADFLLKNCLVLLCFNDNKNSTAKMAKKEGRLVYFYEPILKDDYSIVP